MDGRKLLRYLLVASLSGIAGTFSTNCLWADDYIRPPAKAKPTAAGNPIKQPDSKVTVPLTPLSEPGEPQPALPPLELDAPQVPPAVVRPSEPPVQFHRPNDSPSHLTQPRQAQASQVPSRRLQVSTYQASTYQPLAITEQHSQLNWQPRGSLPAGAVHPDRHAMTKVTHAPVIGNEGVDESVFMEPRRVQAQATAHSSGSRPLGRGTDVQLLTEPAAAVDPQEQHRRAQAERLSRELTSQPTYRGSSAAPLEPAAGWQAIGEQLKAHVEKCEQLLSRRAYLSATEEASQGVVRLARALDVRENQFASEPAWAAAQQAFREAQDFTRVEGLASDVELFRRLIHSHQTPVLHGANVQELTPLSAAQHYRAYAEQSLTVASQGHPWFSELYYCLGRAKQAQAEGGDAKADTLLLQALSYYRAAQVVDPANATNANQLGYVLLRMDRPSEALPQLQYTVQLAGCPLEAWQNLIQASSRLGDKPTEKWALDNFVAQKNQGAQPSGPVNTLLQVTPEQFMALSPRTIGPAMGQSSAYGASNEIGNGNFGGPSGNGNVPAGQSMLPTAETTDRTATGQIFRIFR